MKRNNPSQGCRQHNLTTGKLFGLANVCDKSYCLYGVCPIFQALLFHFPNFFMYFSISIYNAEWLSSMVGHYIFVCNATERPPVGYIVNYRSMIKICLHMVEVSITYCMSVRVQCIIL